MRILVTGVAGFIGSHLAQSLTAQGHKVRGIDCLTDFYSRELKQLNLGQVQTSGVECLALDLAGDDLTAAVTDVAAVFHLAGQPGLSPTTAFDTYARNNLTATHRLLTALEQTRSLRLFVNVATSSVYGADATGDESTVPRPTSQYGVTKLAAEQLALARARASEMPVCSIRPFSVYGPRERPEKLYPRLIGSILEGTVFPLREGSENHLRSYTYVGDIVAGLTATLESVDRCVGEIFNIGTDVAITTGEGIRIVEDITGRKAEIEVAPRRPGDQLKTQANIGKARRLLGYEPTTSAESGLRKEVAWYREHILGKIDLWQ